MYESGELIVIQQQLVAAKDDDGAVWQHPFWTAHKGELHRESRWTEPLTTLPNWLNMGKAQLPLS